MTKELIEKYRKGEEGLTNAEVKQLYTWYELMAKNTKLLGPHYHLMWIQLYSEEVRLRGYLVYRGLI